MMATNQAAREEKTSNYFLMVCKNETDFVFWHFMLHLADFPHIQFSIRTVILLINSDNFSSSLLDVMRSYLLFFALLFWLHYNGDRIVRVDILVLFQFSSLYMMFYHFMIVHDVCCRVSIHATLRKPISIWSFLRIFFFLNRCYIKMLLMHFVILIIFYFILLIQWIAFISKLHTNPAFLK